MGVKIMHKVFCVALQSATGEKTFITFGPNTTVGDIHSVIFEEIKDNPGSRMLGMAFFANPNKKKLRKQISNWKKNYDGIVTF